MIDYINIIVIAINSITLILVYYKFLKLSEEVTRLTTKVQEVELQFTVIRELVTKLTLYLVGKKDEDISKRSVNTNQVS